jgi:hypothetical protein
MGGRKRARILGNVVSRSRVVQEGAVPAGAERPLSADAKALHRIP